MAHAHRPKLGVLRNYAVTLERRNEVHGEFELEAQKLCAFLIDSLPSGTMNEFTKLTGASLEKIFDIGNKVFAERPK